MTTPGEPTPDIIGSGPGYEPLPVPLQHPPEVAPLPWARLNFKGDLTGDRSDLMRTVYGPGTFESGGMYFVVASATYDADANLTRCVMGAATVWHMVAAGLIDAPPGWHP